MTNSINTSETFRVRDFDTSKIEAPQDSTSLRLPWPFESKPLDLEIGCGVGWHPIQYATAHPERNLIAIEHTRAKFEKFQSRHVHHPELTNLFPVHADAIRWVTHALPASSVSRALLLYPNPEPKASNKRWLRSPFMHQLLKTLKPDGEFILASNIAEYVDEAELWAKKAWNLELIERRDFTSASLPFKNPRTHFEKKYLLEGQTCFDLRFKKQEAP